MDTHENLFEEFTKWSETQTRFLPISLQGHANEIRC